MLTKYLQDPEKKTIGNKLLISAGFSVFFALLSLILVRFLLFFMRSLNPNFNG